MKDKKRNKNKMRMHGVKIDTILIKKKKRL